MTCQSIYRYAGHLNRLERVEPRLRLDWKGAYCDECAHRREPFHELSVEDRCAAFVVGGSERHIPPEFRSEPVMAPCAQINDNGDCWAFEYGDEARPVTAADQRRTADNPEPWPWGLTALLLVALGVLFSVAAYSERIG